jgi:hypothetical protein
MCSEPSEEERLSEDIDQLFELTRIIVLVIAGLVPGLANDKSRGGRSFACFTIFDADRSSSSRVR